MHIQCPKCGTEYKIDASSIPTEGRDVQCTSCDRIWFQNSEITLQRENVLSDDLEDVGEANFAKRKAAIILAGTGAAVALAAYVGLSVYQGQQKTLDAEQPVELAQTDAAELPAPNAVGGNEMAMAAAPEDVANEVAEEVVEEPVEVQADVVETILEPVEVTQAPAEVVEEPLKGANAPAEVENTVAAVEEPTEIVETLADIVEPKVEAAELPADAADTVIETAEEPAVTAVVPDKVDDAPSDITADVATASTEVSQPLDEPAQSSANTAGATTKAPKDALEISNALPPSFDIVRVDAVGATVIAGTAEPMANVAIILNGKEFGRAKADKRGKFVALLSMPVSHDAQRLSLSAQVSGHVASASKENVILAPSGATPPEMSADADQPNSGQATVLPAQKAPAVLLSDPNGVRIMQPTASALKATDNLVIDAISYDALGVVQLEGRGIKAEGSGFVRAYLDNKLIVTGSVLKNSAWQINLAGIKAGTYTLRIDQVDAKGAVVSRVETSFQRESAMTLQNAQTNAQSKASLVTVQTGSTLWAIASESYGNGALYVRVFDANRDLIRKPDLIYPGQVFEVPL